MSKGKIAGVTIGLILLLPFAAELFLSICHFTVDHVSLYDRRNFGHLIQKRVYSTSNLSGNDPLLPPYPTYANEGMDDPARLKEIATRTQLPLNSTLESYDILRNPAMREKTKYTVHNNSLGFRGPERAAEKPAETFRIIILGSTQTFGIGLPDDQTYPAVLEKILNDGKLKTKVEVWNGGRPGATAIVGLAQLEQVFKYKPDLLILDYGSLDPYVWGDNLVPRFLRFPERGVAGYLRKVVGVLAPIVTHSYFIREVQKYYSRPGKAPGEAKRTELFEKTMRKILTVAKEHNVPAALIHQLNTEGVIGPLARELNIPMIDVESELQRKPIADGWNEEKAKESWVNELKFPVSWKYTFDFRLYSYRLNPAQLNLAGNTVLAESLAKLVTSKFLVEPKPESKP